MRRKRIGAALLITIGTTCVMLYMGGLFCPEAFAAHGFDMLDSQTRLRFTVLTLACLNTGHRLRRQTVEARL